MILINFFQNKQNHIHNPCEAFGGVCRGFPFGCERIRQSAKVPGRLICKIPSSKFVYVVHWFFWFKCGICPHLSCAFVWGVCRPCARKIFQIWCWSMFSIPPEPQAAFWLCSIFSYKRKNTPTPAQCQDGGIVYAAIQLLQLWGDHS